VTSVWLAVLIASLVAPLIPAAGSDRFTRSFAIDRPGEVRAVVRAGCARCDWGATGREAVALRVSVDGKYSQHLLLARGETPADYLITLGSFAAGPHRLAIERDARLSAAGAGRASIEVPTIDAIAQGTSDDFIAQSMAPILYARPNTVGRFTDLPLFMWYEVASTPRGRQFRYSVIFSNEDGGTPTDRLMATWGRTTDIEFVYGVELDRQDRVVAEEFQGPNHDVPPFKGEHEARHPLQWVSTDNNMVSESGATQVRYAPAPVRFDLRDVSRETVMDAHPWLYAVMAKELAREGKIVANAPPGHGTIPDPRRFVYIEACGEVGSAALAFAVKVRDQWIASDRGVEKYRVARDGCARAAIPLPDGVRAADLRAIRALAYARPPSDGKAPEPPTPVHLTRISNVFMLDDRYVPGATLFRWSGDATIRAGGAPFEAPIP
jgi:hypothetical protein